MVSIILIGVYYIMFIIKYTNKTTIASLIILILLINYTSGKYISVLIFLFLYYG